jgi:hypothetical protein
MKSSYRPYSTARSILDTPNPPRQSQASLDRTYSTADGIPPFSFTNESISFPRKSIEGDMRLLSVLVKWIRESCWDIKGRGLKDW